MNDTLIGVILYALCVMAFVIMLWLVFLMVQQTASDKFWLVKGEWECTNYKDAMGMFGREYAVCTEYRWIR